MRHLIEQFVFSSTSPLMYILKQLDTNPLIAGSGEFGGGCGISGEFYNVVQNNLVRLALLAAADMATRCGQEVRLTASLRQAADTIGQNMLQYLRGSDGAWLWCIDPVSLKPDPAIINHPINKGFGGLNGVLSMSADVLGGEPLNGQAGGEASIRTFDSLFAVPQRKSLFEKYGAWTQFDEWSLGYMTGPSYGHGYAVQSMLLLDRMEMAGKALDFLARTTYQPLAHNHLDRSSTYYFYERIYLPELWDRRAELQEQFGPNVLVEGGFDQGCGALNLVCVAEPLKIARLVLGVDDYSSSNKGSPTGAVKIIPRLPPGWDAVRAENWPVVVPGGLVHATITCQSENETCRFHLQLQETGRSIPNLSVRLPHHDSFKWFHQTNGSEFEVHS
jgi:hypothetical protein